MRVVYCFTRKSESLILWDHGHDTKLKVMFSHSHLCGKIRFLGDSVAFKWGPSEQDATGKRKIYIYIYIYPMFQHVTWLWPSVNRGCFCILTTCFWFISVILQDWKNWTACMRAPVISSTWTTKRPAKDSHYLKSLSSYATKQRWLWLT